MLQYRLYVSAVIGVLLLGVQYIDAVEQTSTITTTTTPDGTQVTETQGPTLQRTGSGRLTQVTDGIKRGVTTGYETVNRITGGRLDTVRDKTVNGYNAVTEKVKGRFNRQRSIGNTDTNTNCILPGGTSEAVVQTTTGGR